VKKTIAICSFAVVLLACGEKQNTATNAIQPANPAANGAQAQLPPGHPPLTASTASATVATPGRQPQSQGKVTGTVAETLDAAGYTYVNVQTADGSKWAAVPQMKLKKGAPVTINAQMFMDNFESKTLKRKFDRIIFGNVESEGGQPAMPGTIASASASTPGATQAMPPNHPATGGSASASPMGTPQQHMAAGTANVGDVKVAKAPGGSTVADVWSSKDSNKDKPVVVRGKVVKFLGGIMGKNWLHLRDGSGSAEKGDNDITVTTSEMAAVGDTVTVNGTLRVDKDFGAGYRYPVIIEDGKISKQ
jgi:hypothetical protein